jgi:hypothetical protein
MSEDASKVNAENADESLPDAIMVTGFPLWLIGWNGLYVRKSDGMFHFPPHEFSLFGCFPRAIVGVFICHGTNQWVFSRYGEDQPPQPLCSWSLFFSPWLLGNWSMFTVSAVTPSYWFWTSQFYSLYYGVGLMIAAHLRRLCELMFVTHPGILVPVLCLAGIWFCLWLI